MYDCGERQKIPYKSTASFRSKCSWYQELQFPADNYLLKVNNRNSRTRCETCSKLTIKTPEWRQWSSSDVFIINFEHISLCSSVSIVNFEQVKAGWIAYLFSQAHSQISSCHNRTHIPPNFPNFR